MRVLLRCAPLQKVVAYLGAVWEIDGQHCLIDWKTTASRYSESEGDASSVIQ